MISEAAKKRACELASAEHMKRVNVPYTWQLNQVDSDGRLTAFAQYIDEVSDVAKEVVGFYDTSDGEVLGPVKLFQQFILPDEPDPLEKILLDADCADNWGNSYAENAKLIHTGLAKRGYEIREKSRD